jgi:hypothetical protein
MDPIAQIALLHSLAVIAAYRGEDVNSTIERLKAIAGDSTENQTLAEIADLEASAAFAKGDYQRAAASWALEAQIRPSSRIESLPPAARAAAWMGDITLVAALTDEFRALGMYGPVLDLDQRVMAASLAALRGQRDEAAAGFAACLTISERMGLLWERALLAIDMALLLGPDRPGMQEAAERSRAIFSQLGAAPFLAKLDAALAAAPTAQRKAVTAPRNVTVNA